MSYLISGATASGKSTVCRTVPERLPNVVLSEEDQPRATTTDERGIERLRATMKLIPVWASALVVVFAGACDGEGEEGGATGGREPIVRDSAGVRIVENPGPTTDGWTGGTEPSFTAGWDPEGPAFTWIQSGRILPDGAALVGDFGSGVIHRLGPDGIVSDTWGRKGEGPGEYQSLDALLFRNDSIFVSDGRLRRLTVLSPRGDVLVTRGLPGSFLHQVSAILSDGRLLLAPGDGYGGVAETRPEWVFETRPILAVHPEAGTVDTLAELPHLRRWYGTPGAGPGPIHVKGRAGGFPDGFAWARSDIPEVRWYDASGRLVQIARWEEEAAALTPEWRERMARTYEEAYRSRGAEEEFVADRLMELEEGLDRHEGSLPYWDLFHVDRLGNVWMSQYDMPGQPPETWRVFNRDGSFTGWIDLPGVISILDVTDTHVLAVRLDELDVPAVVLFEAR